MVIQTMIHDIKDPLSISSSAFHLLCIDPNSMGPGFKIDGIRLQNRWDQAGGFEPTTCRQRRQKMMNFQIRPLDHAATPEE
jgi:hypothetical protein